MTCRRLAPTLLVAIAIGCGRFGSGDPGATPETDDGGDPRVEPGTDAGADGAPNIPGPDAGADAGPQTQPYCDSLATPEGRVLHCWDFASEAPNDGFTFTDLQTPSVFARDPVVFRSAPASFHAGVPAGSGDVSSARQGLTVPADVITGGSFQIEMSIFPECPGGPNTNADPPTVLELNCAKTVVSTSGAGSLLRLSRPDATSFKALIQNVADAGPSADHAFTVPSGWVRLGIAVDLFKPGGRIRIDVDGQNRRDASLASVLECRPGSDFQVVIGVQAKLASAACAVHYDDVVFTYPLKK